MDSESCREVSSLWRSALGLTFALVLLVPLVLFVLCSSTLAQQPSIRPYESEEDLWEAVNDGEITFDEFIELLDLARSGADSLLVPQSDWEALPGSEAGYLASPDSAQPITQPTQLTPSRVDLPWVASIRTGVDADLNEPTGADGYSVVRLKHGNVRANLDFEHDRDGGGKWRRRTLVWQSRKFTLQAGTIEPRWGRGLVVGRRSRVIPPSGMSGSFWQPTRGRFNGVWISSDSRKSVSLHALYSHLHGDSTIESFGALRSEIEVGNQRIGMTLASGAFHHDPDSAQRWGDYWTNMLGVAGADLHLETGTSEFFGEIAVQTHGMTAKTLEVLWPLTRGRFHARAWSYGNGFTNPWGGGPGHSDTRESSVEILDNAIASRTLGERGFDFTTRIAATPSVNLRWDWMSHREAPGENLEHSGIFHAEIKRPALRTTPFIRAQIDEDETESYSVGNYLWWGPDGRELNLRTEFGTHYDDEVQFVRLGLGAKVRINHVVRVAPAIRWVDPNLDLPSDGYWYFYFTETVLPIDGARVEMALVWKKYEDSTKDDLVELRVRGFVR